MFPQTDKNWLDYRALHQNWSYQPTLAGRAMDRSETDQRNLEQKNIQITWNIYKSEDEVGFKNNSGIIPKIYMLWLFSRTTVRMQC